MIELLTLLSAANLIFVVRLSFRVGRWCGTVDARHAALDRRVSHLEASRP